MTAEEAIRACEFWTLNGAETLALGSTLKPEVGLALDGEEYQQSGWGRRDKVLGWAIKIPRFMLGQDLGQVENLYFKLVLRELERREQSA
jgi:hypothetical protein